MSDGEVVVAGNATLEITKHGLLQTTKRPKTSACEPWSHIQFAELVEYRKWRHTVKVQFTSGLTMYYKPKTRGEAKDLYKGITKHFGKTKG